MTSLAFTLGVVPLYLAVGAGAEMRIALGTGRVLGHDRRDAVRADLHAGVLRRHSRLVCRASKAGANAAPASSRIKSAGAGLRPISFSIYFDPFNRARRRW